MKTRILEKLQEVEQNNNIEILFAVESGSRAWGFASPDSDYDIRFVYRRGKNHYLSLWESKDTLQFMTEDELDGSGWDLRKALRLLAKSNASFLGWLFSPIIYIDKEGVLEELKTLAKSNFNPVAGFYHYHSMNKGFDELLGSDEMTLKNFFYAIRTALCAKWIRDNETVPPVLFKELYSLVGDEDQKLLDALIALKGEREEKGKEDVDERLISLAKEIVTENNLRKGDVQNRSADLEAFDSLFLTLVK
jgi:predicted nucleotidyltransferase